MNTNAMDVVRAALRIGDLRINRQKGWQFGRRVFAFKTVARLIELGEAVRDGNMVRAA